MNATPPPTSGPDNDAPPEVTDASWPANRSDALGGGEGSGHPIDSGGSGAVGLAAHRPIPPKLYRIGEVVDYSGVSRQSILNYTTMGLLRETRWTRGGHRLYDQSVFERLDTITELKARSKSLQEIREHFARLDGE